MVVVVAESDDEDNCAQWRTWQLAVRWPRSVCGFFALLLAAVASSVGDSFACVVFTVRGTFRGDLRFSNRTLRVSRFGAQKRSLTVLINRAWSQGMNCLGLGNVRRAICLLHGVKCKGNGKGRQHQNAYAMRCGVSHNSCAPVHPVPSIVAN